MTERKKQSTVYPLRMPSSLKQAVREVSRRDGTSINQFVNTAVAEKLSAMRTAEFFAERGSQADIDSARRLLRRRGGQPPDPSDRLDEPEV
ncbi:MAG: toxin-antitoxin system HicB family antitoxin [Gemmatimonadetes bacterium]|nr:toxin-antitoxin system HicB family antitoxin [Gemmatimonadota bacterium]MYA43727.1 toxin-antitoxin system HicB family antitoxin [Gemmatimonadota bacterium]MYE95723.1 toxin-antitoxin system HicB family antitoxin [Gemmatimonadota bacterium]MYJ12406.1 toxin-antitoxin system HicB family antitoxin [Gemmatimonadota bacterium]